MLGFIKGLLSSDNIIESGMSALDKVILTEEEKIEYKLQFVRATMPMNRARRFLAMVVSAVWVPHAILGSYLLLTESPLFVDFLSYMTINITAPFTVIVGFYFWNEKIKAAK